MAKANKTTETKKSVKAFIESFANTEQKKADSFRLVEWMREWSGFEPKMWGPTIIGFGSYHYRYESGREGEAPVIGFSPRKAEFSLYVYSPSEATEKLLGKLGKFTMGKYCIYVKKLDDIDKSVLEKLCKASIQNICKKYDCKR